MKTGLTNGAYSNMTFDSYKFQEFPKHIPLKSADKNGKKFAIVNNTREEIAIRASGEADIRGNDPITEERNDLQKALAAQEARTADLERQLAEAKAERIVNAKTGAPTPSAKPSVKTPDLDILAKG